MSAPEGRTVAELLDDSDELAREALLDISADRVLGMVRGWPQLMQAAAELWAVLPAPTSGQQPRIPQSADLLRATGRGTIKFPVRQRHQLARRRERLHQQPVWRTPGPR